MFVISISRVAVVQADEAEGIPFVRERPLVPRMCSLTVIRVGGWVLGLRRLSDMAQRFQSPGSLLTARPICAYESASEQRQSLQTTRNTATRCYASFWHRCGHI